MPNPLEHSKSDGSDLKKCVGCGQERLRVLFCRLQERTRCAECRVKASMNSSWYTWIKSGGGTPAQVQHKKEEIMARERSNFKKFTDEIAGWYTGPWPMTPQMEHRINNSINKTSPNPDYWNNKPRTNGDDSKDNRSNHSHKSSRKLDFASEEATTTGTHSRCKSCIKAHYKCDRSRPCGRCKDRNLSACGGAKDSAPVEKAEGRPEQGEEPFKPSVWESSHEKELVSIHPFGHSNTCGTCNEEELPNYHFWDPANPDSACTSCANCRASDYAVERCEAKFQVDPYTIETHQEEQGDTHPKNTLTLRAELLGFLNQWYEKWVIQMQEHAPFKDIKAVGYQYRIWSSQWVTDRLGAIKDTAENTPEPQAANQVPQSQPRHSSKQARTGPRNSHGAQAHSKTATVPNQNVDDNDKPTTQGLRHSAREEIDDEGSTPPRTFGRRLLSKRKRRIVLSEEPEVEPATKRREPEGHDQPPPTASSHNKPTARSCSRQLRTSDTATPSAVDTHMSVGNSVHPQTTRLATPASMRSEAHITNPADTEVQMSDSPEDALTIISLSRNLTDALEAMRAAKGDDSMREVLNLSLWQMKEKRVQMSADIKEYLRVLEALKNIG